MVPIRNHQECYGCHNPAQKINGVLILDYDAGEVRAGMTRDLGWMVAGTGALTFVIVGAIFVVIHVSVLRRLQRLEMTARLLSQGDLKRRAPVEGANEPVVITIPVGSYAPSGLRFVGGRTRVLRPARRTHHGCALSNRSQCNAGGGDAGAAAGGDLGQAPR